MSSFSDGGQAEDAYFAAQDMAARQKIREQLAAKAAAEHERRQGALKRGGDDHSLAERLADLGLDGDTAHALHLVPMVVVAWADGKVSGAERGAIAAAEAAHGIEPHSPAANFVASLLEEPIDPTVRQEMLAVLRDMLAAQDKHPHSLLELAQEVAAASGGLFGFGNRISDDERELLDQLAASLAPQAADEITQAFE